MRPERPFTVCQFTIRGDQIDPGAVTNLLDVQPTKTWAPGDKVTPRDPIGRRKDHGWQLQVQHAGLFALRECMAELQAVLSSKCDLIVSLSPASADVAVYIYEIDRDTDISFDLNAIQFLSACGAELGIDVYR